MMECILCGNQYFDCIHRGTRDVSNINVMRCRKCGMVQLDCKGDNSEEKYAAGGMLENAYAAITNMTSDMTWEQWIEETKDDDDRRYNELKDICTGKRVLEFGCGNGGFLRRMKAHADCVTGIELMDEAREYIAEEGIQVYRNPDEVEGKYDIVCMFMVIEHLNNPDMHLAKIKRIMTEDGILICETPNAHDALITKYKCKAFEDFTYWSKHVLLFDSETLERLMRKNGFSTIRNTQIQRYSLANHLYWLSNGKPGGHMRWKDFSNEKMNNLYAECLIAHDMADTLWYVGKKL